MWRICRTYLCIIILVLLMSGFSEAKSSGSGSGSGGASTTGKNGATKAKIQPGVAISVYILNQDGEFILSTSDKCVVPYCTVED